MKFRTTSAETDTEATSTPHEKIIMHGGSLEMEEIARDEGRNEKENNKC